MTLVTIDLGDVAGGQHPDDHVIIRAEAFRESQGGGVTSTAEVKIPLVDGVGQAEVEPGPVVVAFRCRAVADTREKRGVVPESGPVGIEEVIAGAFEYTPPVVNRGLDLIEDARDEALGQVEESVETQILAGSEHVRDIVGQRALPEDLGAAWAHITPLGDRLPLGYARDGRLDSVARQVWDEDVNHRFLVPEQGYSYALTTESGDLLMGFRPDGTVVIPGLTVEGVGNPHEVWVHRDNTVQQVAAHMTQAVVWGSSTPEKLVPFIGSALEDFGVTVHDQSKGAEFVQHAAARMGAVMAMIDPVTIPASDPVEITSQNVFPIANLRPIPGTLAGVPGTLDSTYYTLSFIRDAPGDAVVITEPTPFIPAEGPHMRAYVSIIGAGKNNILQAGSEQLTIDYNAEMFDYLTPMHPRCLILGMHLNTGDDDPQRISWTNTVNTALRARYGPLFIDLQAIVTDPDVWDQVGIVPTPEDITQQEMGCLPPSLGRDNSHFNDVANILVAGIIRDRMISLGWYWSAS